MNCGDCKNKGKPICSVCCSYQGGVPDRWEPKPITNADRIRAMTDEELALKFAEVQNNAYHAAANDNILLPAELSLYWLDWLRQEERERIATPVTRSLVRNDNGGEI